MQQKLIKKQTDIVTIDGALGEGGGQILRSSLTLSMLTGQTMKIKNIRAKRNKPGLLRQHLTAVKAAAKICNAKVIGDTLGSKELFFIPGEIQGGEYHFAIGSAGSTTLVAQTIIPALMMAQKKSKIIIEGGTHNKFAPTFDFFNNSYLPLINKMGANVKAKLMRYGFFPAGGGAIEISIAPCENLKPINLRHKGEKVNFNAESIISHIPASVAKRELSVIQEMLNWSEKELHINEIKNNHCSANIVQVHMTYDNIHETMTSFGEKGLSAEQVAKNAYQQAQIYLNSKAAISEYLADQLLIPIALAGASCFTTTQISAHTKTNITSIQHFIDCDITYTKLDSDCWLIETSI